jgi:hypothetical protein
MKKKNKSNKYKYKKQKGGMVINPLLNNGIINQVISEQEKRRKNMAYQNFIKPEQMTQGKKPINREEFNKKFNTEQEQSNKILSKRTQKQIEENTASEFKEKILRNPESRERNPIPNAIATKVGNVAIATPVPEGNKIPGDMMNVLAEDAAEGIEQTSFIMKKMLKAFEMYKKMSIAFSILMLLCILTMPAVFLCMVQLCIMLLNIIIKGGYEAVKSIPGVKVKKPKYIPNILKLIWILMTAKGNKKKKTNKEIKNADGSPESGFS